MTIRKNIFDVHLLKFFNEGDMVSWRANNDLHVECGLIVTLRVEPVRGDATREFAVAEIETDRGPMIVLGLSTLKLESKVHKHRKKFEESGCSPY